VKDPPGDDAKHDPEQDDADAAFNGEFHEDFP
jgi:hypothetical protein